MDSKVIETNEAAQATPKVKKPLDPRVQYYLRIIGTLFVITTIVAVLLSLVNMVTKPIIDDLAEQKRAAALAEVMPGAVYEPVTQLPEGIDGLVAMTKATREGALGGYCVQVTTNGFGGAIEMMVGVDDHGAITGITFLSMSETAGVGSKAKSEPWFAEQYLDRSGQIAVSKVQADATHIQAISGATVTSNAVTRGVNNALLAVDAYQKGGIS